jgi:hypothetical protein
MAMIRHIVYITIPILNVIVYCHIFGKSTPKADILSMNDLGFPHSLHANTGLRLDSSVERLEFNRWGGAGVRYKDTFFCGMRFSTYLTFPALDTKQWNNLFLYDTTF